MTHNPINTATNEKDRRFLNVGKTLLLHQDFRFVHRSFPFIQTNGEEPEISIRLWLRSIENLESRSYVECNERELESQEIIATLLSRNCVLPQLRVLSVVTLILFSQTSELLRTSQFWRVDAGPLAGRVMQYDYVSIDKMGNYAQNSIITTS